jgi:ribosomal protein S18 acetylase RimI-like enzyme
MKLVELHHTRPAAMATLLDTEKKEWENRLQWDISRPIERLRRLIAGGYLQGFAVVDGSEVLGYLYYVTGNDWAAIGNLFVLEKARDLQIEDTLLEAGLSRIRKRPQLRKIESHFISLAGPGIAQVFTRRGFISHTRYYMVREFGADDLERFRNPEPAAKSFEPARMGDIANVLYLSHRGGIDARLSRCYASEESCRSFLETILRYSSIGKIEPDASFVVYDPGNRPVGFALGSTIGYRHGHVVQISVCPEDQGSGLGRILMHSLLRSFSARKYESVSLSVTDGNQKALSWYTRLGFRSSWEYPVFVWSR